MVMNLSLGVIWTIQQLQVQVATTHYIFVFNLLHMRLKKALMVTKTFLNIVMVFVTGHLLVYFIYLAISIIAKGNKGIPVCGRTMRG